MMNPRKAADPPKEPEGRICVVCSDRANGFNFGVLTCESCKAFFRRNAAKKNEIRCPFSDSCQITSTSRKFCQACRLNKCISVGMNTDWLVENNAKKIKRKKLHESMEASSDSEEQVCISKTFLHKLMKQANGNAKSCTCTCKCGFYPLGTRLTSLDAFPNANIERYYSSLSSPTNSSILNSAQPSPMFSSYLSPQSAYSPAIATASTQLLTTSMYPWNSIPPIPFLNTTTIGCESSAFHSPFSAENYNKKITKYSKILSTDEMSMLQELYELNEPLNAPLEKKYNQESLKGVLQIVEEALRRIISMAARLKAFQELDIEDRKQLLKSGFCELIIVRGIMAFDKTSNSWSHRFVNDTMSVKLDVLKQDPTALEHYEMHKKLLESFSDEIRSNETIMLIFNAIVIFHPHGTNLKESEKIHATRARYFSLLEKILSFEFPKSKADICYKKLLDQVVDLHSVNKSMLHIFYGLDPKQLDPLVRELCNFE